MPESKDICIIVPCYNEGFRLDTHAFIKYASSHSGVDFIFVDDGSTDNTQELLLQACNEQSNRLALLASEENQGKSEAVRTGVNAAIDRDYKYIGYWDADLAAPLHEIERLMDRIDSHSLDIAIGSRVKILGHNIERKFFRHIAGRLFATIASMTLRLPVYDTQCGAKLFKNDHKLQFAFKDRFRGKWSFDVEIMHRYMLLNNYNNANNAPLFVEEVPLINWVDATDSKVKAIDLFTSIYDLLTIYRYYNQASTREYYKKATTN